MKSKIKKPTFKRQKLLLGLLDTFNGELYKTEIQKYMFLFTKEFSNESYYEFVPYHYGSFSYELYKDLNTLERNGLLSSCDKKVRLNMLGYAQELAQKEKNLLYILFLKYGALRGEKLIEYIYKKYPYFAINSKIAKKFLDDKTINKYRPVSNNKALYTIGYEGKKFEYYLNELIQNDIKVLVDVRKNAHSMKYGFSKNTLKKALENLGIEYLHIPNLGIESENRQELNTLEDYQKLFFKYEQTLQEKESDLAYLAMLVNNKKRVAITCFEKDVKYCHRGVIAKKTNQLFSISIKHL